MGFFQLIFGEIKEEEKAILEEKIIQCYQKKALHWKIEHYIRQ